MYLFNLEHNHFSFSPKSYIQYYYQFITSKKVSFLIKLPNMLFESMPIQFWKQNIILWTEQLDRSSRIIQGDSTTMMNTHLVVGKVSFLPGSITLLSWSISRGPNVCTFWIEQGVRATICRDTQHQLVSISPRLQVVLYSVVLLHRYAYMLFREVRIQNGQVYKTFNVYILHFNIGANNSCKSYYSEDVFYHGLMVICYI